MPPAIRNQAKLASIGFAAFLASSVLDSGDAWAQIQRFPGSPHFVGCKSALAGTNLQVTFQEAGLAQNEDTAYEASAEAFVLRACKTRGENYPKDANKQADSGIVTGNATFSSGSNGQVTGTILVESPQVALRCPIGQTPVTVQINWIDIMIADLTNGVTEDCKPSSIIACPDPDFTDCPIFFPVP